MYEKSRLVSIVVSPVREAAEEEEGEVEMMLVRVVDDVEIGTL